MVCCFATSALGLSEGAVTVLGIASLFMLYSITWLAYAEPSAHLIKHLASILTIRLIVLFWLHCIPGFSNIVFFDSYVSPASSPYRIYLNLDKTLMGIVLFIASPLYQQERPMNTWVLKQVVIGVLYATLLIIPGIFLNYIQLDYKMPHISWVWCNKTYVLLSFQRKFHVAVSFSTTLNRC